MLVDMATLLSSFMFTAEGDAVQNDAVEEEQALTDAQFLQEMNQVTNRDKEPVFPEDATDEQKRITNLERRADIAEFNNGILQQMSMVRTRYPKATELEIQKYVRTSFSGDIAGNFDAMDAVVRTSMEAAQDEEGEQHLEMVEGEDGGAGNGLPQVASTYSAAVRQFQTARA